MTKVLLTISPYTPPFKICENCHVVNFISLQHVMFIIMIIVQIKVQKSSFFYDSMTFNDEPMLLIIEANSSKQLCI